MADRTEHIALLALLRVKGVNWHFVAREAQRPDGLEGLLSGRAGEASEEAQETLARLATSADEVIEHGEVVGGILETMDHEGVGLTTVLDDDYPINLRTVFNLPPFLFYRGELRHDDTRAVAVVGMRQPTPIGLTRAAEIARLLTTHNVTVLSGLARGIDTSAHQALRLAVGRSPFSARAFAGYTRLRTTSLPA